MRRHKAEDGGWPWAATAIVAAITLVFVAPLLSHFASLYPHDAADPSLNAWILWWSAHRVPLTDAWWNAPMFYPMRGAFALSEVLVGLLPITLPVQALTGSPLAAYNTAFVVAFPLCALAVYALALELTGDRPASLLAGIAFAFAPYRMSHLAHLQVLSYYGAPLALLGLHRFVRTSNRQWLWLFGGAWLLQSLSNGYAMFHLAVLIALWLFWFARSRRLAIPIVITWIVASLPLVPVLLTYQVIHSALHLSRNINEIRGFGLDLADLVTAAPEVLVWGHLLPAARPETAAFPGVTLIVAGITGLLVALRSARARRSLASEPVGRSRVSMDRRVCAAIGGVALIVALSRLALGAWRLGPLTVTEARKPFSIAVIALLIVVLRSNWIRQAARARSVPMFYLLAMLAMYVLALGPEPRFFGSAFLYRPPYEWLMALPGFSTLRVPARFVVLALLSSSVLLAMVVARARADGRLRRLVIALTAAGLVIDGAARLPVQAAPSRGPTWGDLDAVIELPAGKLAEFGAIHRGMLHGLPIVNGYSGYVPHHYLPLLYALDHEHMEVLREIAAPRGLGVGVDRESPRALAISAALRGLDGATHLGASDRLDTFVVRSSPAPAPTPGSQVQVVEVSANRMPQDARRMLDGRADTGWHAGPTQVGDEEVIADLGAPHEIAMISLGMGPFAFGFPRLLDVAVSSDRQTWSRVWSGPTDVATVRGALADPGGVPIRIDLTPVTARYIRLRQTSQDPEITWWIAELTVYAPAVR